MTTTLERLKNGETAESIIADLEKSVLIYTRKDLDNMTNLKRIRETSGISQSKLAEESGVSVRMIQHYEQGVKDLNRAQAITVYRLAQALDCKVEDLLETE
jgi:DNA-binding transcriptional regulator YiaG